MNIISSRNHKGGKEAEEKEEHCDDWLQSGRMDGRIDGSNNHSSANGKCDIVVLLRGTSNLLREAIRFKVNQRMEGAR